MAQTYSRHINVGLLALLAVAAALALFFMRGGIGGTGVTDGPGGVGGTGVFGRINGFGSIWVNGREIDYDENLPLTYRGATASSEKFAIGQIVAVVVDRTNDGWRARTARIVEEVIGPIEMTSNGGSVVVLKQKILFTEETIYANGVRETMAPGSMIAVSGFRTPEGAILATRIDPVGPEVGLFIRGAVANLNMSGFSINDLDVTYEGVSLAEGDIVAVNGTIIDARFAARDLRKDGAFEGYSLRDISYQGVADTTLQTMRLRVGEFSVDRASTQTVQIDGRAPMLVVLNGQLEHGGSVVAVTKEQLIFEPQNLQPAPDQLHRSTDDEAEQQVESQDTERRAVDAEGNREESDNVPRDVEPTREAPAVDERTVEDDRDQAAVPDDETDAQVDAQQLDAPQRDSDELDPPDETSRETDDPSNGEAPERAEDPAREDRPEIDERPSRDRPVRPERPAQDRPERFERPERPQRPDRR